MEPFRSKERNPNTIKNICISLLSISLSLSLYVYIFFVFEQSNYTDISPRYYFSFWLSNHTLMSWWNCRMISMMCRCRPMLPRRWACYDRPSPNPSWDALQERHGLMEGDGVGCDKLQWLVKEFESFYWFYCLCFNSFGVFKAIKERLST